MYVRYCYFLITHHGVRVSQVVHKIENKVFNGKREIALKIGIRKELLNGEREMPYSKTYLV